MNPQTQNQNSQNPNFDFILNQGAAGAPKKRDPRIVVIIVMLVLLVIAFAVGAVLSSSRNVQQTPEYASGVKADEAIRNFLNFVADGDYDGAVSLVSSDSPLTKQSVAEEYERLLSKLDLKNCQAGGVDQSNQLPLVSCKTIENDITLKFSFQVIEVDGVAKVFDYQLAGI